MGAVRVLVDSGEQDDQVLGGTVRCLPDAGCPCMLANALLLTFMLV